MDDESGESMELMEEMPLKEMVQYTEVGALSIKKKLKYTTCRNAARGESSHGYS